MVEVFINQESAGATEARVLGGGDQVDATEEFHKAGAGDLVKNLETALLGDKKACLFHHG